jgi:threonylcarbamoyladenosine tRNA methylthiotransferase MtaB
MHEEAPQPAKPRGEVHKVVVFTNGCKECRNEAAHVEDFFRANGWGVAADFSDASLIIFQGCGVVQPKAEQTLNTVKWLRQEYPANEILVWGCISVIDPEGLRQVYKGPTFGPRQLESFNRYAETTRIEQICSNRMVDHVHTRIQSGQKPSIRPYAPWGTALVSERCRAWSIQAATGCRGACTYCRIRESRGPLCSKPIDQIIAEFHAGLERGYDRFVLLGTDLGCYGMDRDSNLVALLRAIAAIKSDFRVWVRHLNPRFVLTYLDELTSQLLSRIDILELSAQSGSDDVLAAMNRRYTASDFLHIVSRIRALKPKIAIKGQFMVGFPGETEQDFKRTVDLIRQSSIDFSLVFRYSPAPGRESTQLAAPLPANVVNRRARQLKLVVARRALAYAGRCLLYRRHRLWLVD